MLESPDLDWDTDPDPIEAAARQFNPADPSPLIRLLESGDPLVSQRGLFVFEVLGKNAFGVLDAALRLAGHPHEMARNYLMDGVMCYSSKLNAAQTAVVLTLIDDPFVLVREKVIVFLAHADFASLDGAIAMLGEPERSEHSAGMHVLRTGHPDPQELFDQALAHHGVWRAYAFAALERMARKGLLHQAPQYDGEDQVPEGVVHFINMWVRRRLQAVFWSAGFARYRW